MLSAIVSWAFVAFVPVLSDVGLRNKVSQQIIDNQGPYHHLLPLTQFYISDKTCTGYLEDNLLTCPGQQGPSPAPAAAAWLNVTVEDYASFAAVVVHGGARSASLYRGGACAGDALVTITRFCAVEPDLIDLRAVEDGFALPESDKPNPFTRIAPGDEHDDSATPLHITI